MGDCVDLSNCLINKIITAGERVFLSWRRIVGQLKMESLK